MIHYKDGDWLLVGPARRVCDLTVTGGRPPLVAANDPGTVVLRFPTTDQFDVEMPLPQPGLAWVHRLSIAGKRLTEAA